MTLDLDFVRAQFPAFNEAALQGQAFFENAGGSYTCAPVIERLMRYYTQRKVQPYGPYEASRLAGEEMDEARVRLAEIMGVETDEVSFGPSTTQNTYVLSQAFAGFLQKRRSDCCDQSRSRSKFRPVASFGRAWHRSSRMEDQCGEWSP